MKIITFDDIASLKISPYKCYEWVLEAVTHKTQALLPPKISMKPSDGVFCNIMPSIMPAEISPLGYAVGGVKMVTRYPDRKPSLDSKILLFNADTGETLALMDGNFITAMRTGAVAAHSVKLFAKKNYSTLGIMGLGNTARAFMLVLAEIDERNINVKLLKYKGQEESFAQRFSGYEHLHFEFVNTPEDVVCDSDVVMSAVTYAPEDFCRDECFGEGVLVIPVHTLGFTNCDLFFDKVFADDTGHVKHFKNFEKFRSFAEVCDVVNGRAAGRENDSERILAYNIGISLHDINFAAHILSKGIHAASIDMKDPESKFWL